MGCALRTPKLAFTDSVCSWQQWSTSSVACARARATNDVLHCCQCTRALAWRSDGWNRAAPTKHLTKHALWKCRGHEERSQHSKAANNASMNYKLPCSSILSAPCLLAALVAVRAFLFSFMLLIALHTSTLPTLTQAV